MNDRRNGAASGRVAQVDLARRRTLLGVGAAGALAGTESFAQAVCVLTEDSGEGPFYFDPELVRADITEGGAGAPLEIAIQIRRAGGCAALPAARVDLWHADALGLYSGYANQPGVGDVSTETAVDETWLRGTQMTDAEGWVRFLTIYPSWYGGRTPHLHFKVLLGSDEVLASQILFPDEVNSAVFSSWAPYNEHVAKRTVFNDNDPVPGSELCEVERHDERGVLANVVVTVEEPA